MDDIKERRCLRRRLEDREPCLFHEGQCRKIADAKSEGKEAMTEAKKKVPLWTVPVLVTVLIAIGGTYMVHTDKTVVNAIVRSDRSLAVVLSKVEQNSDKLHEVALNQRLVMEKIGIDYQYYNYSGK
jgi:hypothetical protein